MTWAAAAAVAVALAVLPMAAQGASDQTRWRVPDAVYDAIDAGDNARASRLLAAEVDRCERRVRGDACLKLVHTLADQYRLSGDPIAGERVARSGLAVAERVLGSDAQDTATFRVAVALNLHVQQRYDEAEALYRSVLADERAYAPRSSAYAILLNNLAETLRAKKQFDAAEALYRRSLTLREQLGDDAFGVAIVLNNIGLNFDEQNRPREAIKYYRESLAIKRRILPANHPSLASTLENIAGVMDSVGEEAEADALFREALAVRRRRQGDRHPDLANSLHNYAWSLMDRGKYARAERYFSEAEAIVARSLAPGNSIRTAVEWGYANALRRQQRRLDLSRTLYRRAAAGVHLRMAARPGFDSGAQRLARGFRGLFADQVQLYWMAASR